MKPINADNPIAPKDVGRVAVRRDGERVRLKVFRSMHHFPVVADDGEACAARGNTFTAEGRYWNDKESPYDLIGWADEASAHSPHTIDMTLRVPLDRVSEVAAEFEVLGTTGPQAKAEDTEREHSEATTAQGTGQ